MTTFTEKEKRNSLNSENLRIKYQQARLKGQLQPTKSEAWEEWTDSLINNARLKEPSKNVWFIHKKRKMASIPASFPRGVTRHCTLKAKTKATVDI